MIGIKKKKKRERERKISSLILFQTNDDKVPSGSNSLMNNLTEKQEN